MRLSRSTFVSCAATFLLTPALSIASAAHARVRVRINSDEADAVLTILDNLKAGRKVQAEDWQRLYASEGYRRLKKREAAFKRSFTDAEFGAFVMSHELRARSGELRSTLNKWTSANIDEIARRPLSYLRSGARLHATVYPLIKPRSNSFVWELDTNPAIMLYLDPSKTRPQFENTVAHELFHVGDAQNCPPDGVRRYVNTLPAASQAVFEWLSAFGEGAAVLAAAGGPHIHPHAVDSAQQRAVWDRDLRKFNSDLRSLQAFFLDVLDGRLKGDAIATQGFTFFDGQGPWYTVGWKMYASIENELGHGRVVSAMCDRRKLLSSYNEAADRINSRGENLAKWSRRLASLFAI
jgi:hypothetical protein